jgi:hypothetical protein
VEAFGKRAQQPFALVLGNVLAGEAVAAAGKTLH